MVWMWQHDKRTDDYKIILNCVRKIDEKNQKNRLENAKAFYKKYCESSLLLPGTIFTKDLSFSIVSF
jgi:hypothetical protein